MSINDFLNRVNPKDINKLQLEGLVKAGAFDKLNINRQSLFDSIPNFILKSRVDGVKEHQVNSTPSFLINRDLYAGSLSADRIDEILEGYLDNVSPIIELDSVSPIIEERSKMSIYIYLIFATLIMVVIYLLKRKRKNNQ